MMPAFYRKHRGRRAAEQRASPRYGTGEATAKLVWGEEGEGRAPVVILDLSLGGARLICDAAPEGDEPAWILGEESEDCWAEIEILGREPLPAGLVLVRARFLDACPYDLFKLTVFKTEIAGRSHNPSPEFESRYWR